MSRFKVSVIALGIIVLAIVTLGACAGQASARSRTHVPAGHLASRTVTRSAPRSAALLTSAADSEWAVASHVNW